MSRVTKMLSMLSPYVALAIGLMLTFATVFYALKAAHYSGERRFTERVGRLREKIASEVEGYSAALVQTRSLFEVDPGVDKTKFGEYVADAGILHSNPGVLGIGYAPRVPAARLQAHQLIGRGHISSGYHVWPIPSEARSDFFPIYYFEPHESVNREALGFDMASESKRHEAMETARDTGQPALSGPVLLVTRPELRWGLQIFVPIYRRGMAVDTVAQRRRALDGFVFGGLKIESLFASMIFKHKYLDDSLYFELFEGNVTDSPQLVYRSNSGASIAPPAWYSVADTIDLGGKRWTLRTYSKPAFEQSIRRGLPWFILAGGGLGTCLLFFLLQMAHAGSKALEKNEKQLRLITDAIPSLIAYVDTDHRYRFNNKAYEKWFGRKAPDLFRRRYSDFYSPEVSERIRINLERAFNGEIIHYSGKVDTDEWGHRYIDTVLIPDRRADGRVAGAVVVVSDVSEQRRTQEQFIEEVRITEALNRVGTMLAGQLDIKKLLQDVADSGIEVTGAEFGAVFYNASPGSVETPMLYAAAARDVKFLNQIRLAVPIHWGEDALRRENLRRVSGPTRDGDPASLPVDHPFRMLFGAITHIGSYLGLPLISRLGQVMGLVAFGHSRSDAFEERMERFADGLATQAALALESARLYEELESAIRLKDKSLEEIRRSNAELQQFTYIASHDLKEPLRMVTSYVRLLERRYSDKLDADGREYIHFAVDGATRMYALINDLLLYSRVGTASVSMRLSSAEEAVRASLTNLGAAVQETGAEVTWSDLPAVSADPSQLVQLFQNLIGNAIKYRGSEPPKIHIGAELDGKRWKFSVTDNGIGIEPQFWDRIFIIFQRLHGREKYPGTGIGLSICKKIVARHGGEIWVRSQPGQGSVFYFTLPVEPSRRATAPASLTAS